MEARPLFLEPRDDVVVFRMLLGEDQGGVVTQLPEILQGLEAGRYSTA